MDNQKQPHRAILFLFVGFLLTFFGGGLAVFVNLFVPFLNEAVLACLALVLMAEVVLLVIAGKCIHVVEALRAGARRPPVDSIERDAA